MKMELNGKNQYSRFINIGLLLLFITIIILAGVWVCTSPVLASSAETYTPQLFHQGWSQQIGDQTIPLENIHDYTSVPPGESLVFTCTLPEVEDNWAFLFYSDNKEVFCYVDDVLIQDFSIPEGFELLKTAGSAWCQVDLCHAMSGKTCTLIFNSPDGQYAFLDDIYFVNNQYVDNIRFIRLWPLGTAAFAIFFIIIMFVCTGLIGQLPRRRRYLISTALYFLTVLLWLLAELNFYDIFFGRPLMCFLLSQIFKRMIPVALLYLARNSTNKYWHPNIFNALTILVWANFLVPLVLQFFFQISLFETTMLHCVVSAVVNLYLLIITGEKLFCFKKLDYEEYPCLLMPILALCNGVDITILFLHRAYRPFTGIWTAIGCVVFAVVTLIVLTYVNSRVAQERVELQRSCDVLENTALIKQIEAHFIFNMLNTISAFCKTDPTKADKTVIAFSIYLRTYLTLVNYHKNIPIEQEVKFVKNYLYLQQIRFEDRLKFTIDADFLDFEVPPFVIHTLVENAIIHGIRGQSQGGTVSISTKRNGNVIQLIVADTGAGFDITSPIKTESVGLQNIEKRLKIMVNGTLSISSRIGEGTTAIVEIPMASSL